MGEFYEELTDLILNNNGEVAAAGVEYEVARPPDAVQETEEIGVWMPQSTYNRLAVTQQRLMLKVQHLEANLQIANRMLEQAGQLPVGEVIPQLPTVSPTGELACKLCGRTRDKHGKPYPNRSILANHERVCKGEREAV